MKHLLFVCVEGVLTSKPPGPELQFEHAELLARLLTPYPQFPIVLMGRVIEERDLRDVLDALPLSLDVRVIGVANKQRMRESGNRVVLDYLWRDLLDDFVAVDYDAARWGDLLEPRLVITNPQLGLGEERAQLELAEKLKGLAERERRVNQGEKP